MVRPAKNASWETSRVSLPASRRSELRPGTPPDSGLVTAPCIRLAGGVFGNGFEHFSLRGSARASEGYRSQAFA